jgi:polysaccharide biosynthesis transport protein
MQYDQGAGRANATNEAMMAVGPLPGDLSQQFEDGLSARALLTSIRRHMAIVVAFTLALCAAGTLVGLGLPAWFNAKGVLVIHARPQRMAELQELPDPSPDPSFIQSEVDILQSRSVIEPVVRSLKLWEAPEFQEMKYPNGWSWQTVEERIYETWRDIWGSATGPEDSSPDQSAVNTHPSDTNPPTQAQIDGAVLTYQGHLVVSNDGHSNTINVSYQAWTPERAAAVVNAHIDSYRNLEVKAKMAAAEHANSALTSQVAQLRQQLQAAEEAVTRYREEHHLTGAAKDSAGVSAQLTALNSQLITARADLAENEARAARIGSGAGGESLPEVVASGTIGALRGQEAQLLAREADLAKYHGDEYPDLRRVRASLQTLRDQISRQVGRDRAAALQLAERSRTRERSLQQSITELTKQLNSADAGLQQLQGKADSIRSLLVNFEKRVGETAANPAFITANSTIASRASEATASTSSKTKVLAVAGGFVGLTLGSLLSLLLEIRDKGFRTSSQVQQHFGSLTVSATPRAIGRSRKFPADLILSDNRSVLAEAFRVTWANLHLAVVDARSASFGGRRLGTALGITSASSGEGKSTHALALARTAALAGESVVVIDADLRRAGLSRLLNQDFCFTLRDFLRDRCTASEVIAIEQRSGVHFVPSTPADVSWTTHDLHRFSSFVDYLKDRFSIVIIDLPPIVGIADTIRLAMTADRIALVIRWGRTERQFVQFALDALRGINIAPIGVILNDIDLKAQRRRGYRDSTVVYTDKRLYRAERGHREPARPASLPMAAVKPDARSDTSRSELQPDDTHRDRPRPAGSDIERLYNKYHD